MITAAHYWLAVADIALSVVGILGVSGALLFAFGAVDDDDGWMFVVAGLLLVIAILAWAGVAAVDSGI